MKRSLTLTLEPRQASLSTYEDCIVRIWLAWWDWAWRARCVPGVHVSPQQWRRGVGR